MKNTSAVVMPLLSLGFMLVQHPTLAQIRETITFWEFPGYAVRIFREGSQYKINLYNRQTRTLELNAAPVTRQTSPEGDTYTYRNPFDVNIFIAKPQETTALLGNCSDFSCPELLDNLQQRFPAQVSDWTSQCTDDLALSAFSRDGSQRVGFLCWEPPMANGRRNGAFLGTLPYPGEEAQFPVAIASEDPTVQAILDRHPNEVQAMGFDCAIREGNINVIAAEDSSVVLQCFFQAGVQLLDIDGDGVSDGENSRGASVDFTRVVPMEES